MINVLKGGSMKRYRVVCMLMVSSVVAAPLVVYARGGGSVAGGLVGGLAGGMIAGSIAHGSGSSRAENEAARAQDKAEQLQVQQERDRVEQLRRDMEERKAQESRDTRFYLILIMAFAVFFGIG